MTVSYKRACLVTTKIVFKDENFNNKFGLRLFCLLFQVVFYRNVEKLFLGSIFSISLQRGLHETLYQGLNNLRFAEATRQRTIVPAEVYAFTHPYFY